MPEDVNAVTLGEVYRSVEFIRNNMVSKEENNAVLAAVGQRITSIEQNLAAKNADAAHDHAELDANSKQRNLEVKAMITQMQADIKADHDKTVLRMETDLHNLKTRIQGQEDDAAKRRNERIFQYSIIGITFMVSAFGNFILRGIGLG